MDSNSKISTKCRDFSTFLSALTTEYDVHVVQRVVHTVSIMAISTPYSWASFLVLVASHLLDSPEGSLQLSSTCCP